MGDKIQIRQICRKPHRQGQPLPRMKRIHKNAATRLAILNVVEHTAGLGWA